MSGEEEKKVVLMQIVGKRRDTILVEVQCSGVQIEVCRLVEHTRYYSSQCFIRKTSHASGQEKKSLSR